jgi:hypothetical protein
MQIIAVKPELYVTAIATTIIHNRNTYIYHIFAKANLGLWLWLLPMHAYIHKCATAKL